MEKKIEDYLHLYMGCDLIYKDRVVKMQGIKDSTPWSNQTSVRVADNIWTYAYEVKLILRPLSDMTGKEKTDGRMLHRMDAFGAPTVESISEMTRYLLLKQFDCFGLIEAGLAIDKPTL